MNTDINNKLKLNDDVNRLLQEVLDKIENPKWDNIYTGKVVNVDDPDKLGRVTIRVFGVYGDEIKDKDLPWATPDQTFVGSKMGNFIVPPKGALVRIYFDNNDIYLPIYTSKAIDKNNLSSKRLTNYPKNMILFETDEGDSLELNRQTKNLLFTHNSGVTIEIKKNKNFMISQGGPTGASIEMASNKAITIDQGGPTGASIEMTPTGTINIQAGPLSPINLGGAKAVMACPDMQSCIITGAPLAIGTLIPGSQVNVP